MKAQAAIRRISFGVVQSNGGVAVGGSGDWQSLRTGTGSFTIWGVPEWPSVPVVVLVNAAGGTSYNFITPGVSGAKFFTVETRTSGGVLTDYAFCFQAVCG